MDLLLRVGEGSKGQREEGFVHHREFLFGRLVRGWLWVVCG